MGFRAVLIAVVLGTALVVAAYLINWARPGKINEMSSADLIRASGKCAECHIQEHYSIVHEYGLSAHARNNINCLQCHQPAANQSDKDHHGFKITTQMTAGNCRSCHEPEYEQFAHSRHAAPAWAAVYGKDALTADQIALGEKHHPGSCNRPPNPLVGKESAMAAEAGCVKCHAVGKPNADGTVGTCTACHTRHTSSVEVARLPSTCGQCHMGPDHSQLEIYEESRHGVLFQAQRHLLKLDADPKKLTTREMFIPTCATCHMSGLNDGQPNGQPMTHDPSDRLSWNLFAEVSDKRLRYEEGKSAMKKMCGNCHAAPLVDRVFADGEKAVLSTNQKVQQAKEIVQDLRKPHWFGPPVLRSAPFENPIDFVYFDLWHYYGRTVKHGAFMGGADFVQWHGNYPLLKHTVELRSMADELRRSHGR
jgi:hypothetical protein